MVNSGTIKSEILSTGLDESQGFLFYEKKHHIDSKKYRYAKTERIPIIVRAMI